MNASYIIIILGSKMESIASSVEDHLIGGLSFKLSPTASYITDRKSSTYWPTGSDTFTPTGTKVIKISLNSEGWLDPSTVRFMFDLNNLDTTPAHHLRTLSGAWSFFRRIRILCRGTLVEDFDYNRVHEMFHALTSKHSRENDLIEDFGHRYDDVSFGTTPTTTNFEGILGNKSQTVGFKLLSGILNQSKYLPLKYMPLTIELELVSSALDVIVDPTATGFTTADTSNQWSISNVQLKADICTLDNAFQNDYDAHLLGGKSLPVNFNSYITQSQAVSSQDVAVNLSRAVTRLKSFFITLANSTPTEPIAHKSFNDFFHPLATLSAVGGKHLYDKDYEMEYQIQIGSKLFPEYPVRSLSESFAQLKKTLGILGSNFHSVSINAEQYRTDKFIMELTPKRLCKQVSRD